MIAAEWGNVAMIRFFIDYGADVNYQDEFGNTPLRVATVSEWPKAVTELLKLGAEVDRSDNFDWTPFMKAANKIKVYYDKVEIKEIEEFQERDRVACSDDSGKDLVEILVKNGKMWVENIEQPKIVEMLLNAGADINKKTETLGWTAAGFRPKVRQALMDLKAGKKKYISVIVKKSMDEERMKLLQAYSDEVDKKFREGQMEIDKKYPVSKRFKSLDKKMLIEEEVA